MYTAKVFYRIVISSSYIADREKDLLLFVIGSFGYQSMCLVLCCGVLKAGKKVTVGNMNSSVLLESADTTKTSL